MKALTKYANFTKIWYYYHKGILKAASGHLNAFPKASEVDNLPFYSFLQLSEKTFCDRTSGFQNPLNQ